MLRVRHDACCSLTPGDRKCQSPNPIVKGQSSEIPLAGSPKIMRISISSSPPPPPAPLDARENPLDLHGNHARHVPGGIGPDDHRGGAAADLTRSRGCAEFALGGDRLSPGRDHCDAALRQSERHLRAQGDAAFGHRDLRRRIDRLRARPHDARSRARPRAARARRGRLRSRSPRRSSPISYRRRSAAAIRCASPACF